jgi:hypothetical protein
MSPLSIVRVYLSTHPQPRKPWYSRGQVTLAVRDPVPPDVHADRPATGQEGGSFMSPRFPPLQAFKRIKRAESVNKAGTAVAY